MMALMVHIDHTDTATRACPCGASLHIADYTLPSTIAAWMATHTPHTNGRMVVQMDGSWSKFFSTRPSDYEVKIVGPTPVPAFQVGDAVRLKVDAYGFTAGTVLRIAEVSKNARFVFNCNPLCLYAAWWRALDPWEIEPWMAETARAGDIVETILGLTSGEWVKAMIDRVVDVAVYEVFVFDPNYPREFPAYRGPNQIRPVLSDVPRPDPTGSIRCG